MDPFFHVGQELSRGIRPLFKNDFKCALCRRGACQREYAIAIPGRNSRNWGSFADGFDANPDAMYETSLLRDVLSRTSEGFDTRDYREAVARLG